MGVNAARRIPSANAAVAGAVRGFTRISPQYRLICRGPIRPLPPLRSLIVLRLILWLPFLLALLAGPAQASERVALVIGNGNYANAGVLPNPPNDAQAVASALRDVGFDVALGRDLDRAAMERLLRDFLRKAATAKVALLFYAGHGMQVDGRNYLLPVDAKIEAASDLGFETVELDKILGNLEDAARATIVILDACRDNPLSRSFAARSRSASVGTGLAAYSTLGTGTLIAFATAPGKVALDGTGKNSPFTEGLVKHLRTPGLEVRAMLTRVRADVMDATGKKQLPWDNSSLMGDVYLAGPSQGQPQGVIASAPPVIQPQPSPQPVVSAPPPVIATLPPRRRRRAPRRSTDSSFRIRVNACSAPASCGDLTPDQLRIARNEIYARRGRFFRDQALATYFSRFSWYRPTAWDVAGQRGRAGQYQAHPVDGTMMRALIAGLTMLACIATCSADPALDALVAAYPDHIAGYDKNELIFKDGTRIAIDDGMRGQELRAYARRPGHQGSVRDPLSARR